MEEWKEYNFNDITINYDKNRIPLSSKERETRKGEYRYFGAQGVIDYVDDYIFDGQYILLAEDGENLKSKKQSLVQFVSGKFWVNNHAHILTGNEKCDIKFLFYLLDSIDFTPFITGSAQPKLSQQSLSKIYLKLPPLPTQQKIAAILSSLDDKIELNNKINTNLEQQAQTLFKNWFVDFEPFGGKMPEGWKVGKLGEFVEIKRGGSPRPIQKFLSDKGYRWLKISDVTSLSAPFVLNIAEHIKEEGLSKTVFLKAGSLVLSNSATPGIPKILDLDTCIHDGWLYFPKSQLSNEYLYLLFKEIRPQLLNLGNGSIFTNLKTDILKDFEISLPSTETLSKFQNIIKPIFEKVLTTQREIKQLETLRDTLLPKLMNGEVEI